MSEHVYRVAAVALHPIQYQAGLWRTMARHPRFDLQVLYLDRVGIDGAIDPTLNAPMKWEMPLLEGYEHEFVTNVSPFRFTPVIQRINPGLFSRLRAEPWDAVIVHGYLIVSNWLAVLAAKTRGTTLVYRGEGSLRGGAKHEGPLVDALKHPLNAFFLRSCDAIAYSSEDNRAYQLSRGAPEERLFPLPCAVDNEALEDLAGRARSRAAFRAEHGIPDDAKLVINVSRFQRHKGTADCIAAFSAGPLGDREDVHLVIIGDGPLRQELHAQARASVAADRIHFLGFVNQPEVVEAVLASDLFLLASTRGDPSPKALSEALYLSRAAVCSDGVGTCEDLITPGENGLIFPAGDVEALARSVTEVLADPERLREMGKRSHEVARANDFQAGVDSLAAKLDELREARG